MSKVKKEYQNHDPNGVMDNIPTIQGINFKQSNQDLAKDQPEYQSLRVAYLSEPWGRAISVHQLDEKQLQQINQSGKLYFVQCTMNAGYHPIKLMTESPFKSDDRLQDLKFIKGMQIHHKEIDWVCILADGERAVFGRIEDNDDDTKVRVSTKETFIVSQEITAPFDYKIINQN